MRPHPGLRLVPVPPRRARDDVPALLGLLAIWLGVVLLIDPRGDFPLNDDWAYGLVVRGLVEHGRFEPNFWQGMPLVSHVAWGALFARVFGFSWWALRLSSLSAGALVVLGCFMLLREVGWSRRAAFAGACVLLANPWLVALSATFMTDVPFTAAVIWSAWAWLRAIGRGELRWLGLAVMLALVAVLNRQLGLALPLAFALPLWQRSSFGRRSWLAALAPIVLGVAVLLIHDGLRHRAEASASVYDSKSQALAQGAWAMLHLRGWARVVGRSVAALMYLGLFSLPLTLRSPDRGEDGTALLRAGLALLGGFAGGALLAAGWSMPLLGNVLVDFGIGPRTLAGSAPRASSVFWPFVTVASGAGAALLIEALCRAIEDVRRDDGWLGDAWKHLALLCLAAISFAPSALAEATLFDRHLLPFLPLVWSAFSRPTRTTHDPARLSPLDGASIALALAFLSFSLGGTHDYLAWQRVRAALVREALRGARAQDRAADRAADGMADGAAALEAGFEPDNLSAALTATVPPSALADRSQAPRVVASSPLPRHRVLLHAHVSPWLPAGVADIYVLARPPAAANGAARREPGR